MSRWCRLWEDMPNDPKWRVIAKRSGRPIAEVLAVFVHMMTNAANSETRGQLRNWNDEDVATALDLEAASVSAIREAMQGKTLNGDALTGWEKRQPLREDGSAERAKAWRDRKKTDENAPKRTKPHGNEGERNRTHANATEKKREDNSVLTNGQDDLPFDSEKGLYACGQRVLGKSYGPVVTQLRQHYGGDILRTRQTIEDAADKHNAMAYLQGIIRNGRRSPPQLEKRNSAVQAIEELKQEAGGWELSYQYHA